MYRLILRPTFSAFLALFLFNNDTFALQTLSLKDSIQTAMQNSPALQKADAARTEGKWKGIEGVSTFLPTVGLTANHYFDKKFQVINLASGSQFESIFPTSSATIEAKWTLFDGLQNIYQFKSGQNLKKASEANYEWAKFELEHNITLAYEKVVAAKKLEEVSEQNLKTLQNHLAQIKQLKSGGLATNYDVLRVESQLSEAEADSLQAKDNIQIAQERLGQEMGQNEPIDVTDLDLAVPNTEKIKNLTYHEGTDKRLDLEALRSQVEASNEIDSASSLFWTPKVGLIANYTKYNNITDPLSDWDRYRSSWAAGFFLTWELFNPRDFSKARQEAAKAAQADKSLVQAMQAAPVDFAFWKKRYLYSASLYQAKKIDLDRANETVRLGEAGFKAGVRTTTEVLDAELELFRARAGIVNAQMNCIEAKLKLELSLGESL